MTCLRDSCFSDTNPLISTPFLYTQISIGCQNLVTIAQLLSVAKNIGQN